MKKILIVDYIVGGGFIEEEIPYERLAEGYALLRTAIEQFAQDGYQIATLIDQRLMQHIRISPIHEFISVGSYEDFLNGISDFSNRVDYSLTIAPESKGIQKDLASIICNSQSTYLGSEPEAIEVAADKLKTMEVARQLDLNVPATFSPSYNQSFDAILDQVDILRFPLIVKPIDSIGGQGLTKVNGPDELRFGLQVAHSASSLEECIVQEYIEGLPISTSLIASDDAVLPLSINRQNLRMDSQKSVGLYVGGELPLELPEMQRKKVLDISIQLVEKLNLRGFVGVDLILTKDEIFVIEVNPRLTVPFLGLKGIMESNIASVLVDFVENGKTKHSTKLTGCATFSKTSVPISVSQKNRFEIVAGIDGVLSPPFPLSDSSYSYSILVGFGSTITKARQDYQRVKNAVLKEFSP